MAQDHWKQAVDGSFDDKTKWESGAAPAAGDDVFLDASGAAFTVKVDSQNESIGALTMATNATLQVEGDFLVTATSTSNAGTITVASGATFEADGPLANSGAIALSSLGGSAASFYAGPSGATLSGGGQVTMQGGLIGGRTGATLTNLDNTIAGDGAIAENTDLTLVNQSGGVIDANDANPLLIDSMHPVTNAGLIRTTGAGGLQIVGTVANSGDVDAIGAGALVLDNGGTIANGGPGQVSVGAGASLSLDNGAITGGAVSIAARGVISSTGFDLIAGSVANAGTINASHDLQLGGALDNTGTVSVAASGGVSVTSAGLTLTGGGQVKVKGELGGQTGSVLTNVDNTITGGGAIALNTDLTLVNEASGTIDANDTSQLLIDSGHTVTNVGVIESTGSGGLQISSTVIANSGGLTALGTGILLLNGAQIQNSSGGRASVVAGAHMSLVGSSIAGGQVNVASGGTLSADGGVSLITADTIGNQGTIAIPSSELRLTGTLANIGMVAVAGRLSIGAGELVLNHGGRVVLSGASASLFGAADSKLVNVDNIISGSGLVGDSGGTGVSLTIKNKAAGVIRGDGATPLTLSPSGKFINDGALEGTGAGGLTIANCALDNLRSLEAITAGGTVGVVTIFQATVQGAGAILDNGAMHLANSAVQGGVLKVAAGRNLYVDPGVSFGRSTVTGTTFVNKGAIAIQPGASLEIDGALKNTGSVAIDATPSNGAGLEAGPGGLTLSGGGQVTLADTAVSDITTTASAGAFLTNVDNTITGAGQIGNGTPLSLDNRAAGVIDASGTNNPLVLSLAPSSNEGLIESTGAGGMTIANMMLANTGSVTAAGINGAAPLALYQTTIANGGAGSVSVEAGAVLLLQGAQVTGGALTVAAGGLLDVAPGVVSTSNIAVSTFSLGGDVKVENGANLTVQGAMDVFSSLKLTEAAGVQVKGELTIGSGAKVKETGSGGCTLGADMVLCEGILKSAGAGLTVASPVENDGVLSCVGGNLAFSGDVTGSGAAKISGGVESFGGAFSQSVAFGAGGGQLGLAQSQSYAGTITGFATNGSTSLNLGDIDYKPTDTATFSAGVLTVSDGTHTADIHLAGTFVAPFTLSSNGQGGTLVLDTGGEVPGAAIARARAFAEASAALAGRGGLGGAAVQEPPGARFDYALAQTRLA